jgi:hypothetical protein
MPSDRCKRCGRRREIEEPVAARIAGAFDPRQLVIAFDVRAEMWKGSE